MSIFRPFRNPTAIKALVITGAVLKLAPTLVEAQQRTRVNVDQIGGQSVAPMPYVCDNSTGVQSTVINITSTQTQVVAGSTKSVYVCGYSFGAALGSSATWKWVQGTSTDCISGQADLSAGWPLSTAATFGIVRDGGGGVLFKTSSGNSLCIDTTSSGLYGQLTYISST